MTTNKSPLSRQPAKSTRKTSVSRKISNTEKQLQQCRGMVGSLLLHLDQYITSPYKEEVMPPMMQEEYDILFGSKQSAAVSLTTLTTLLIKIYQVEKQMENNEVPMKDIVTDADMEILQNYFLQQAPSEKPSAK